MENEEKQNPYEPGTAKVDELPPSHARRVFLVNSLIALLLSLGCSAIMTAMIANKSKGDLILYIVLVFLGAIAIQSLVNLVQFFRVRKKDGPAAWTHAICCFVVPLVSSGICMGGLFAGAMGVGV